MKRVLHNTGAATSSQRTTKDTASGSSAALQDTCWKHFKGLERETSDSYWLAVCMGFVWVHADSFLHIVASPCHSFVTPVTVTGIWPPVVSVRMPSDDVGRQVNFVHIQMVLLGRMTESAARCRQKAEIGTFCQPIVVGTARVRKNSQHTLWDAFASRDLIELDRDIDSERDDMFAD